MIFHQLFSLNSRMRHWSELTLTLMLVIAALALIVIALRGPTWLKIFAIAYVYLP